MNLQMYLLTLSKPFQKDSSYKCQFRSNARAPPMVVSQVYVWAKYKDEVPNVLGSNQLIETTPNSS